MNRIAIFVIAVLLLLAVPVSTFGQDFPYDKSIWPTDLKVNGSVMAWNGDMPPAELVEAFLGQGKSEKHVLVLSLGTPNDGQQPSKELIGKLGIKQVVESKFEKASSELLESIRGAKAIWVQGNVASSEFDIHLNALGSELQAKLAEGIPLLFSGTAFDCPAHSMTAKTDSGLTIANGLSLIPDSVITSIEARNSGLAAATMNPRLVSIAIPADTGVLLRGRKIRVLGQGKAWFQVMANERKPHRVMSFGESAGRRPNPYTELVDLTAWRRDAIDRTLPMFPPAKAATPNVETGTLMIVGGGGMPRGLLEDFVKLAGGKDAKLVFVPCSENDQVPEGRLLRALQGQVASATQLHTKDRLKADTDEEFLKHLSEATGVWFGGGRQWNFVDSYYGTKAHRLMLEVLDRGGVIAGSSAGASIQGEYLARANPVGNFDIMAPGYERGLGFLKGVAIDQHFSQRRRQKNMTSLADTYPQLLGIGIDEATALIVNKSVGKVTGRGRVFFYDRNQPVVPGEEDFVALKAGQSFDLAKRKVIDQKRNSEAEGEAEPKENSKRE